MDRLLGLDLGESCREIYREQPDRYILITSAMGIPDGTRARHDASYLFLFFSMTSSFSCINGLL